jgi:hypothetical protein
MKQNQNNLGPILAGIVTSLLCLGIIGGTIYFGVQYFNSPKLVAVIPDSVPETLEQVKAECADGECIEGCVARAAQAVGDKIYPSVMETGYTSPLVSYKVEGNELLEPSYHSAPTKLILYRDNNEAHHRIWDYFIGIVPLDRRPGLAEFDIYAGGESGAQYSPTEDGDGWILRTNVLSSTDSIYLTQALVHEFGHFITLNPSQQVPVPPGEKCEQEKLFECPAPDSYLNLFFEAFWPPVYGEWVNTWGDAERNYRFYLKHSDQFVTDYAASQPIEDIAESWTAFIIHPKPTSGSIADQKVLFFYQFPELVDLRYEMIYGICNYEPPAEK